MWGPSGGPRLADYAERPDLVTHVATIEADADRLGLVELARREAKDARSGEPLVAVALGGEDAIGRPLHAARVASPWGVVLARGPLDLRDVRRAAPTELLGVRREGAGPSAAPPPLTDLNGDGTADVVLRSERGDLEVWSVTARASTQVLVLLDVPARELADVDADGWLDLGGRVPVGADDPLQPALVDLATRAAGGYSHRTVAARAFHAARRDRARAARSAATRDVDRLRSALEAAWHAILAGGEAETELRALDRERVPAELRRSFDDHGRRVARIGR